MQIYIHTNHISHSNPHVYIYTYIYTYKLYIHNFYPPSIAIKLWLTSVALKNLIAGLDLPLDVSAPDDLRRLAAAGVCLLPVFQTCPFGTPPTTHGNNEGFKHGKKWVTVVILQMQVVVSHGNQHISILM